MKSHLIVVVVVVVVAVPPGAAMTGAGKEAKGAKEGALLCHHTAVWLQAAVISVVMRDGVSA